MCSQNSFQDTLALRLHVYLTKISQTLDIFVVLTLKNGTLHDQLKTDNLGRE